MQTDAAWDSGGAEATPLFDRAAALDRLGGDLVLFRELAEMYRVDSRHILDQVRDGLNARDARCVERGAHTLKGMAAMFGAQRAGSVAASMEQYGRSGDLEAAARDFKVLEAETAALAHALQ